LSFKKDATRIEIKKEDDAKVYVVIYFQDDENVWHRIKFAIPKNKLEKV